VVANHTATVEILDLNYNGLDTIDDGAFEGMCQLRHLRLSGNRLTTLTRSMFQADGLQWKLTRLYLNGNRLTEIEDHVFDDLSTIELIDLDDNPNLELTDKTFGRLHKLSELSLDNCGLEKLPTEVFAELV
jgi:Leucine-rich repeat (LRR) protein